MGFIYILTFPNGKKYVGQTRQQFADRFEQHVRDAMNNTDSSPLLHKAIRKYGRNDIKHEVIEIPDDALNMFEMFFVEQLGTLTPDGYNLTTGGQQGTQVALEVKVKMSEAHRKYAGHELRLYMTVYQKGNVEGFRILRPDCEPVIICDSGRTMDEKYQEALRLYDMTPEQIAEFNRQRKAQRNKAQKHDPGPDYPLQDYLTYKPPPYEGFRVRKPGKPKKAFMSTTMSKREKYQAALAYLNS